MLIVSIVSAVSVFISLYMPIPKITIKTKKGLTGTITSQYPITVKKKTATLAISIDSHPSQVARVGDRVGGWRK